jgi:hypothetical protein
MIVIVFTICTFSLHLLFIFTLCIVLYSIVFTLKQLDVVSFYILEENCPNTPVEHLIYMVKTEYEY